MKNFLVMILIVFSVIGCRSLEEPVVFKEADILVDGEQTEVVDQVKVVDSVEGIDQTEVPEQTEATEVSEPIETIDRVEAIISHMTLEEKVAQLFYISLSEYEQLGEPPVGGLIYFSESMTDPVSIRAQNEALQDKVKVPFFIGIDEEGGIVTRISGEKGVGGTLVPSPWRLSQTGDIEDVYKINRLIGSEINALGFNMNFAPVGDIRTNLANPIIGKRAYSQDGDQVSDFVKNAIAAYVDEAIIPVVKHFPGHGDTQGDSHLNSVQVSHDMERLEAVELQPFKKAIEENCPLIMVGHIQVPNVTGNDQPASLSKALIKELLQDDLGYKGIVISDALNMKGITNSYSVEEVIDLGLDAGLDMFLMPEDYELAYSYLLDQVTSSDELLERVNRSLYKIIDLKVTLGIYDQTRLLNDLTEVGSEAHKDLVEMILK